MLAHKEPANNMSPKELLGNLLLLIVGGNDTTRNSITGGVLTLNQFTGQYEQVLQSQSSTSKMVQKIVRWQSQVAHMAKTALEQTELYEILIKK